VSYNRKENDLNQAIQLSTKDASGFKYLSIIPKGHPGKQAEPGGVN